MKLKFSAGILIYHLKVLYSLCLCVCDCARSCVIVCVRLSVTMCTSLCLCVCVCECGFIGMCISDRVAFQPGCNSLAHLSVNRICMPKGSRAFWKSNSKILDWLTHRDRAQENYQFRFRGSHFLFTLWLHMLMLPRNKMHTAEQWLVERWLSILFSTEILLFSSVWL